jgi:hypothetical protein
MAVAKIATKAMNIPPKTLVIDPLELTGSDEVVGAAADDLAAEEAAEADDATEEADDATEEVDEADDAEAEGVYSASPMMILPLAVPSGCVTWHMQ